MLRVLAKDRKLDPFFFEQAGIIGAEEFKPDTLILALLGEGLLFFR